MAHPGYQVLSDILTWPDSECSHTVQFRLFRLIEKAQFTPVLALYDPFGIDVPLNFDIINHLLYQSGS